MVNRTARRSDIFLSALSDKRWEDAKCSLAKDGIDVNVIDKYKFTSFQCATKEHQLDVVKLLVNTVGIDVDEQNNKGQIPLHFAAQDGRHGVRKLLVNIVGIDVNVRDNTDQTPLQIPVWGDSGVDMHHACGEKM